jgi:mannose-6-phosphate isomerase-like protein (cupin superfamily)
MNASFFESKALPFEPDLLAPDGSEIRLLAQTRAGSSCHCSLPPGAISKAVKHQTVEEIWYFVGGLGEIWRKFGDHEEILAVKEGVSLTIPVGTEFQFRNLGSDPLRFLCFTMPPWPGADEALFVEGKWR